MALCLKCWGRRLATLQPYLDRSVECHNPDSEEDPARLGRAAMLQCCFRLAAGLCVTRERCGSQGVDQVAPSTARSANCPGSLLGPAETNGNSITPQMRSNMI